jgi:hypothetical protein
VVGGILLNKNNFVHILCSVLTLGLAISKAMKGNWIGTVIAILAALYFFSFYLRTKIKR